MADPADVKGSDVTEDLKQLDKIVRSGDLEGALEFCGAYWTKRKAGALEPTLYNGDTFVLTIENRIKDKFAAESQ